MRVRLALSKSYMEPENAIEKLPNMEYVLYTDSQVVPLSVKNGFLSF